MGTLLTSTSLHKTANYSKGFCDVNAGTTRCELIFFNFKRIIRSYGARFNNSNHECAHHATLNTFALRFSLWHFMGGLHLQYLCQYIRRRHSIWGSTLKSYVAIICIRNYKKHYEVTKLNPTYKLKQA